MKISSKTLDHVIQTATAHIVEVIGDYVELKKKGSNWWGLSPFKTEKTPSFAVSPSKGIYKCFSSGKGGGVVNFLMEIEGLSFYEAILQLAKKFNIPVEWEDAPPPSEEAAHKDSLFILNDFANQFFIHQLENAPIAQAYLQKRGISEEVQKTFQLGYAPPHKDALTQTALKNRFQPEFLTQTGLSLHSETQGWLDRFRNRIMFPIRNLHGKIIGFGGRTLENSPDIAKYLNSPESILYNKSQALYGIYEAKETIRKKGFAILAEGYLDVISLHQYGFQNAVASCGTAFTPEQARLLKRFTQHVTILYDGDSAGIAAALKALDILLQENLNPKILILPDSEDPDSYLQKYGKQNLEALLHSAQDAILFKLNHLKTLHPSNSPQDKIEIIKEITDTLSKIQDDLKRTLYVQQIAPQLDVSENILNLAIHKKYAQDTQKQEITYEKVTSLRPNTRPPFYEKEKELLRLFFYSGNKKVKEDESVLVSEILIQKFQETSFHTPEFEWLRTEILQYRSDIEGLTLKLLNHEDPKWGKMISDFVLNVEKISPQWQQYGIFTPDLDQDPLDALQSAYLHYDLEKIEQMVQWNLEALQKAKDNDSTQWELLLRHQKLLQLREEIHKKLGIVIPPGKIGH